MGSITTALCNIVILANGASRGCHASKRELACGYLHLPVGDVLMQQKQ